MRLTVLGCSGSAPGPGAATSGYLLEAEGFVLGLELGSGTLAQLQHWHDPFDLDALLFSHLHADHCADFSSLAVLRRYHPAPSRDPRATRLPVHAPHEAPTRFAAAYGTDEADRAATDLTDVFAFAPLTTGTVHIGPFEVTSAPAAHPCEAFAFRIAHGGRVLAYTGDTGWCASVRDLVAGADALLAEASWTHGPGHPPDLHLSGTEAGRLADQAGAGHLLVTHIAPWTDPDAVLAEATAAFAGQVTRVQQGAQYQV